LRQDIREGSPRDTRGSSKRAIPSQRGMGTTPPDPPLAQYSPLQRMLLAYAEDRVRSCSMGRGQQRSLMNHDFKWIKNTPHLLGEAYVSLREKVISRNFKVNPTSARK
jgi:hypothetical protein